MGVATVLVATLPSLSFAFRGDDAHSAIETAGTLAALLAAFILFGRVRERPSRRELLLFAGLGAFFVANLARSVAPSFDGDNPAVVWVPLTANLLTAMVLAGAAFASDARVSKPAVARSVCAILGGIGAAMVAVGLLAGYLSPGIDPGISPADADDAAVTGSPGLLTAQIVSMAFYALAAGGFARRAEESGDELLAWLALGLALAALSRLNYFLYPSIYSDWVFTGDILRLASYVAILAGALRQIAAYQRTAAEAAVLADRNRIARDLHDTLAQDLAYISLQGDRMASRDERAAQLARTARLALAASRGAIEQLRRSDDPVGPALERMTRALAARHGVELGLAIDPAAEVSAEARDELLRIAGEAISNAVRHGDAGEIRIELSRHVHEVRLIVGDDGAGFEPDAAFSPGRGLGLPGMRDRARRVGGSCTIASRPGGGTRIEVVVPAGQVG